MSVVEQEEEEEEKEEGKERVGKKLSSRHGRVRGWMEQDPWARLSLIFLTLFNFGLSYLSIIS